MSFASEKNKLIELLDRIDRQYAAIHDRIQSLRQDIISADEAWFEDHTEEIIAEIQGLLSNQYLDNVEEEEEEPVGSAEELLDKLEKMDTSSPAGTLYFNEILKQFALKRGTGIDTAAWAEAVLAGRFPGPP